MSVPVAPLQVCAFVSYFNGFADPTHTPNIGVYAMCDPTDALSAGIRMRVERCTGALCTEFALRGNSTGVQFATSPDPQAEYIDNGAYGTIYRYRVRFENNDGNGPYSSVIQINTATHDASVCDTGTIGDFKDQLHTTGLREIVESTLVQAQATGLRKSIEWDLSQTQATGLRSGVEWKIKQTQATGLRIIIEYIFGPLPAVGESQLIVWW